MPKAKRDFVLVVSEILEGRPQARAVVEMSGIPLNESVGRLVSAYLSESAPMVTHGHLTGGTIDQYELWDWNLDDITAATRFGEIAKPGIFFATRWPTNDPLLDGVWRITLRESIFDTNEKVKRFMAGPGALVEPVTVARIDVFISYASEDESLAIEFHDMLVAKGMKCFLAKKSIGASSVWRDAIRESLQNSAVVLVLLTQQSIKSSWVLIEWGAFWALGKPIFPA